MADSYPSTSPPTGESPAQEKARLRREKRTAKIAAGGASRLEAISSLQGGPPRDVQKDLPTARPTTGFSAAPAAASPAFPAFPAAGTSSTGDPDEIDISEHHYTPAAQPRLPSPFAYSGNSTPQFPSADQTPDPSQDPMMSMLQQMLGAGSGTLPGGIGLPGQQGGMPPGLESMFSGMQGGAAQPSPDQSSAWVWRIVHSLFSLALAIYIVLQTPFSGSKLSRGFPSAADTDWTLDSSSGDAFKNFFYMFATFEVVMQSSRYFIERGQLQGSGMLSSVAQFLPEPYAGYIRLIGRYSVIYSTVVSDAMVVVFVLGAASWLRGDVAA